jgi:hypothetical protein
MGFGIVGTEGNKTSWDLDDDFVICLFKKVDHVY